MLWCGYATQIDTDEGPLCLATVEDLFSRRMSGHAMSAHHDAALAVASPQMAAATRGGDVDGAIFHTDRGSEYTAAKTAAACQDLARTRPVAAYGAIPVLGPILPVALAARRPVGFGRGDTVGVAPRHLWRAECKAPSAKHRAQSIECKAPITT